MIATPVPIPRFARFSAAFALALSTLHALDYGDIPTDRIPPGGGWVEIEWTDPGNWTTLDVTQNGVTKDNNTVDAAVEIADLLTNNPTGNLKLYFPAGTYTFKTSLVINRSNIWITGDGMDSTVFEFDPDNNDYAELKFEGGNTGTAQNLSADADREDTTITVADASTFAVGDYLDLYRNDFFVDGQTKVAGQIVQITAKNNNTLTLDMPLGIDFSTAHDSEVIEMDPVGNLRVDNLTLVRVHYDSTVDHSQEANLEFERAVNIYVHDVESDMCTNHHIAAQVCRDVRFENNNIHGAFDYGGGGHGYGLAAADRTTRFTILNNTCTDLRHHIILQRGANHGIVAYNNVSFQPGTVQNAGSQVCVHGRFPHNNLIEGNYADLDIEGDEAHEAHGPYNTFFRNFGRFIGNKWAGTTHTLVVCNEADTLQTAGTNNFVGANVVNGTTTWGPDLTQNSDLPPSLFLASKPGYATEWPLYGPDAGTAETELVAHWKLDETTGTTAVDETENDNDGTLTGFGGTFWVGGQVGNGLSFDGADDVVNAGSDASLDDLAAITVSAWIKPDSTGEGGVGRIIQKGTGLDPTAGFRLIIRGTNQIAFGVDYATTDLHRRSSENAVSTGVWNHIVATWTGSATATNAKLYVNGSEVTYSTTTNGAGARNSDAAASLYLGNTSTQERTFDGVVDDVQIFNGVLDAGEVEALYEAGAVPQAPSGLSATAVDFDQINLSWTDNAGNETGYEVERKKGAGGTFAVIATPAANATSFNDTTAGAGTEYTYRVRATGTVGDSTWSNEATDTSDEITSGRQAHWKLDETTGTSADDSSGNPNDGTAAGGPAWVAGQIGNGLEFDGANDVLACGSDTSLDNPSALTFTAWVKIDSMGGNGVGRILQKGEGTDPAGGYRLITRGTNQLAFGVDYATTDLHRRSATNAFSTGVWTHVTVTWTGSATATNAKIYVNGTEVTYSDPDEANGSGARGNDGTGTLRLGNIDSQNRGFDGVMDDVRVYNRVLSADEITAIHRTGL